MHNSQKILQIRRILQILSISLLSFAACPNYAFAYGGHGYYYGYGHGHNYGHHGYRHYGHHDYGAHYNYHGHIGSAGYVFLGILSFAILSQILDNNNDRDRRYRRVPSYNQPPTQPRPVSINDYSKAKSVYEYSNNEGWDWLAKGNTNYALDIFAIQSQQNLNSAIPKIGFAIAAATNGEMNRATRAMRKAIRVDADALDKINIINIKPTIETLTENYQSISSNNKNNTDNAFMVSVFSYLQQDYSAANNFIAGNDQSQSANNLRKLIMEKEGISLH